RVSAVMTLTAALLPAALAASPSPSPSSSLSPAASATSASTGSASSGTPSPTTTVTPGTSAVPGGTGLPTPPQFSPQLEWPLARLRAGQLWRHGLGAGVTVAVIDTGINTLQPDLAGAVLATEDFTARSARDRGADESSDSHGTAVAGIIAAR